MEKKTYNWLTVLLLNIVTCGIYSIYVFHCMSTANNEEAARYGIKPRMTYLIAFLLGLVTCGIVPLVWFFLFNMQQVELAQAKGVKVAPVDNGIVLGLLMFIPFYSFYVICDNYNRTIVA